MFDLKIHLIEAIKSHGNPEYILVQNLDFWEEITDKHGIFNNLPVYIAPQLRKNMILIQ